MVLINFCNNRQNYKKISAEEKKTSDFVCFVIKKNYICAKLP